MCLLLESLLLLSLLLLSLLGQLLGPPLSLKVFLLSLECQQVLLL